MAMTPDAMASKIKSDIDQINDPSSAMATFYSALCDYVEANAQVFYAWAATNSSGTPDPQVIIEAKIITNGLMTLSGANTPESACSSFSSMLNSQVSTWMIKWPAGFSLTPAFVIPSITITPSKANTKDAAWLSVCSQIIAGIKAATPAAAGSHAAYVGVTSFTSIL